VALGNTKSHFQNLKGADAGAKDGTKFFIAGEKNKARRGSRSNCVKGEARFIGGGGVQSLQTKNCYGRDNNKGPHNKD